MTEEFEDKLIEQTINQLNDIISTIDYMMENSSRHDTFYFHSKTHIYDAIHDMKESRIPSKLHWV